MIRGLSQLILLAISLGLAFVGIFTLGFDSGLCCGISFLFFIIALALEKDNSPNVQIQQIPVQQAPQNVNYMTRYNDQSVSVKDSVVNRSNLSESGDVNNLRELSKMHEKGQLTDEEFKELVKDALKSK